MYNHRASTEQIERRGQPVHGPHPQLEVVEESASGALADDANLQMLSVKDVAKLACISEKTVRRDISAGRLRTHRLHRRVLVSQADYTAWIGSYRERPDTPQSRPDQLLPYAESRTQLRRGSLQP